MAISEHFLYVHVILVACCFIEPVLLTCGPPRVNICEVCPRTNPNCHVIDFDASGVRKYCYRAVNVTANGVVTTETGLASEDKCVAHAHLNSANNPPCRLPNPPPNTHCFDCCINTSCDIGFRSCNAKMPVDTDHLFPSVVPVIG